MAVNVVIIDDEYLAIQVLESFISKIPDYQIIAKFENPLDALDFLHKNEVDVLFIDIQMPQITGISFARSMVQKPLIVFTTAYPEHAVEAFDLDVLDYLVKPISFERFLKSVVRINAKLNSPALFPGNHSEPETLTIKADGAFHKIKLNDILYIESDREYVKIFTEHRRFYFLERLKNIEDKLPQSQFTRIHKSYIVRNAAAQTLDGNMLTIRNVQLPVSREKRQIVLEQLFKKQV